LIGQIFVQQRSDFAAKLAFWSFVSGHAYRMNCHFASLSIRNERTEV
jgi:hypothetical protein